MFLSARIRTYTSRIETDMVIIYDPDTGHRTGLIQSEHLSRPVHLALDPTSCFLLIGNSGNDSVARVEFDTKIWSILVPFGACALNGPAGIVFGWDGAFYVASPLPKEVLYFSFVHS